MINMSIAAYLQYICFRRILRPTRPTNMEGGFAGLGRAQKLPACCRSWFEVFVGAFKAETTQKVWPTASSDHVPSYHQTTFNTPSGTWTWCSFDAFCVNVSDDISSTWPFWRWAEHVQSSPHILLRRPAAVFRGIAIPRVDESIEVCALSQTG